MPATQWAAMSNHCGMISDAPYSCVNELRDPNFSWNEARNGKGWSVGCPPMIAPAGGADPRAAASAMVTSAITREARMPSKPGRSTLHRRISRGRTRAECIAAAPSSLA